MPSKPSPGITKLSDEVTYDPWAICPQSEDFEVPYDSEDFQGTAVGTTPGMASPMVLQVGYPLPEKNTETVGS